MARARAAPIPHLHHPRTPEQPNGSTELAEVCRTPEPISSIAYLIRLESRMGDEWGTGRMGDGHDIMQLGYRVESSAHKM